MRSELLAAATMFVSTTALAEQAPTQVEKGEAAWAPSASSTSKPPPNDTVHVISGAALIPLAPENIEQAPVLRRLAKTGAQLFEAGSSHSLRSIVARRGEEFMIFQMTPDGEAIISGVQTDLSVERLLAAEPGASKAVHISALDAPRSSNFGIMGSDAAPRMYIFVDPLCGYSVRAFFSAVAAIHRQPSGASGNHSDFRAGLRKRGPQHHERPDDAEQICRSNGGGVVTRRSGRSGVAGGRQATAEEHGGGRVARIARNTDGHLAQGGWIGGACPWAAGRLDSGDRIDGSGPCCAIGRDRDSPEPRRASRC
jgi:hypothetical protein